MAQDNSFEGDHSLQPHPEVMGATASATMLGHPHHQISLSEDLAIPKGSTPDHRRSALPKRFDMNQMMEMLKQMMDKVEGNIQAGQNQLKNEMRGDMQMLKDEIHGNMQGNIQTQLTANWEEMKVGQKERKAELEKIKVGQQSLDLGWQRERAKCKTWTGRNQDST